MDKGEPPGLVEGKKMTIKELISRLKKFDENLNIDVSVDISTGDDNFDKRVFGDIVETGSVSGITLTLLAIEQ